MTAFLIISAFTIIWCIGLTICTQEDMVFHKIRVWAESKEKESGSIFYYPLILCHWCMPSIHSLFGYSFAFLSGVVEFNYKLIILYPLVIMLSSFTIGILWQLYVLIEAASSVQKNREQLTHFDIKDRKFKHTKRLNDGKKNEISSNSKGQF